MFVIRRDMLAVRRDLLVTCSRPARDKIQYVDSRVVGSRGVSVCGVDESEEKVSFFETL